LWGTVSVSGATKNSGLKQMAAALLAPGVTRLRNMPTVSDLGVMAELLRAIGARVEFDTNDEVLVDSTADLRPEAPYELVTRMRASINVLGPLLTRCGHVRLSLPGGDDFGARPIDMHVAGLEAMGTTFKFSHGYLEAYADRLHGADIIFDFPSVGATENLLTAAVLADGVTTIDNAAREPEIIDLCDFLIKMGAHIDGVGTSHLSIEGVRPGELHACEHETVADRIQAATYIAACAVAGGELTLLNAQPRHMEMVLARLRDMGLDLEPLPFGLRVAACERMRSIDVATTSTRADSAMSRNCNGWVPTSAPTATTPSCAEYPGCRVRRYGPTTFAPERRWWSRAWQRRARRRSRACTTSTAATTTWLGACQRSEPTSSGYRRSVRPAGAEAPSGRPGA
jgi:UDP-N-acetylglucosamine 1-carboxyvinyltransferase